LHLKENVIGLLIN